MGKQDRSQNAIARPSWRRASQIERGLPKKTGGQRGIRTLERLLTVTHFPGVRLKPLGHLSGTPTPANGASFTGWSGACSGTGTCVVTIKSSVQNVTGTFSKPGTLSVSVASVGARVLLLVPIGVTTVLFPRVAVLRDRSRERRHLLAGDHRFGDLQ